MKLRNLFLASVACAGLFTACSNEIDEVVDNGNNGTNKGEVAYASFAYTLPNGPAGTRADQSALGKEEVGTDAENKVVEIAFVLFNEEGGSSSKIEILERAKFSPEGSGASTTYKTVSPIMISTGKQHVYVVVNPSEAIKEYYGEGNKEKFKGLTEDQFKAFTEKSFKPGDGFTMSNADLVSIYTIDPKAYNTVSNPVKVTVSVERMAARIDYTAVKENNEYDVVSATGDKVQIQNYRIVNTRTNAFLLKRVGTKENVVIGAKEDGSYVIDPIFAEKSKSGFFNSSTYTSGYDNRLTDMALDAYTGTFPTTANATTALSYCHENTMEADVQKTGAATGLIMKAQYTPKFDVSFETNTKKDFYRYNGILYPTLKQMYKSLNPDWTVDKNNIKVDVLGFKGADETDFDTFAATFDFAKLQAKYVDLYAGGICYYTTYLKHINNNQSMGIMEYAIVRNNIYKLSINSVNKLGTPVPPTDPDKPIEEKDTYLDVTVNVLDWTTRDNSVDL